MKLGWFVVGENQLLCSLDCRLRCAAISLGCSRGELSILQDRRWKVGCMCQSVGPQTGGRGKSQFCVGTNEFHCHLGRSGPRGGGPFACLNILELWYVWELWGCSDMHETITVAALLWPSRPSLSSAGHVWPSATVPRFPSTCYIHR